MDTALLLAGTLFSQSYFDRDDGKIQVFGWDGKSGVDIFVDNNGTGAVNGINWQNKIIRWLK
jgi:hypothetical protein